MVTQYNFSKDNTEVGFLRSIMMQLDLERYFLQAYTNSSNQWGAIDKSKCDVLLQKYSENEISTLFKEHRIEIE